MTDIDAAADRLAGHLAEHLVQGIWDRSRLRIDGVDYESVGADELPAGREDDLVLRAPDGTLYDVDIEVMVDERPAGGAT